MKTVSLLIVACLLPLSIIAQTYTRSYDYKEKDGFCWKKVWDKQGNVGVADLDGRLVLPMRFSLISYSTLEGGFKASVASNSSQGFYTQTGKCVLPNERGYEDFILWNNDEVGCYFEVWKNGYKGICDGRGNEIIKPNRYTGISLWVYGKQPFFQVEKNNKHGICDAEGKEIVPLKYPQKLVCEGGNKFWYLQQGEMHYVTAARPLGTYNPFKNNKVEDKSFYVDFGGEEVPGNFSSTISDESLVAERKRETPVQSGGTSSNKVERVGDVLSEEEIAAFNGLIHAANLKEGESITVQIPATDEDNTASSSLVSEEAKEEARRQIRREGLAEARESIQRKDYIDAYNRSVSLLKDNQFYPKDPDEQCEFVTFLDEVKKGITSDMLAASVSVNVNKYLLLSTVYMDIEGWQKKLLASAIGQGSQKAVFMLQVMNAANGGGSVATPNTPIDFNQDYEPDFIQVEERCTLCNGSGKVRTQSVATYGGQSQYVDETCPSCGGTGNIKHLRNNPRKGR